MLTLKRLAVISASLGAGAVLAAATVFGVFSWYSSRPKPPKPWDQRAIVATFDYPELESETAAKEKPTDPNWRVVPTIVLYYTLENTTERDYRLPKREQLEVSWRLKREKSLAGGQGLAIDDKSVFIPAKQRHRFVLHLGYPMEEDLGPPPKSREDDRRRWKRIAEFMKANLTNVDGFVIFDPEHRSQINLPNGWDSLEVK